MCRKGIGMGMGISMGWLLHGNKLQERGLSLKTLS